MLETRKATVNDSELITRHRKAMFADMRDAPEPILEVMARSFEPWVRRMLAKGKYAGWITSDGDRAIASAGLLVLDWAPHFLDPGGEQRGYVLNVFVEPEYRRRGLAQMLTRECLVEAKLRGIRVVACTRRPKDSRPTRNWDSRRATRCSILRTRSNSARRFALSPCLSP